MHQATLEKGKAKDCDMSELMKGITDIQRSGQEREQELSNLRKEAEDKAANAEKQARECREKLVALSYEKKSLEDALEAAKSTGISCKSTIQTLQKEITNIQAEIVLQKELRSKSEEKEKEERSERIALSAQMVALTQEHALSEVQLRESMDTCERQWSKKYQLVMEDLRSKEIKLQSANKKITGLESQQASLKEALSEQKTVVVASKDEEIGRLKGEVNVMKERLNAEVTKLQSVGMTSEEKVKELEEIIRLGHEERRK